MTDSTYSLHGPVPLMPPASPLVRPIQDLAALYSDDNAPGVGSVGLLTRFWRAAIFLPALFSTAMLGWLFVDWFSAGGLNPLEMLLIGLVTLTFFWIALSVSTVSVGVINLVRTRRVPLKHRPRPMNVALLVPVYNEVPWDVFGNAAAMMEALRGSNCGHDFSLFILSDSRDEDIAAIEMRAMQELRRRLPCGDRIFYRRREDNTDRKVGNLADWVENHGGDFEAMLVLDADSLMTGPAIISLADEMSRDPSAGLIQSFPQLFGAQSLFGRVQQFSSAIYGSLLAEGLAVWSDREGNYWGHNAIIRTEAFAACAGLPRLSTRRDREALILSHDFVEAGLLRRGGWSVRFLPRIRGSYEETPATLVDYVLRDRRWCQGNLQHLRLLRSRGFHAVSRFHLFQGAMAYLLSPAWFVLLLFWAILGRGSEGNVVTYFNPENPLVPIWPELASVNNVLMLLFMYGMLLLPKVMGASAIWMTGVTLRKLGGFWPFVSSFLTEVLLSVAFAPILMVQQTIAVLRTLAGYRETWTPQQRQGGYYPLAMLARFHALETALGLLLCAGMWMGLVSLWLLPIAVSLLVAVPLSALSGADLRRWAWAWKQMRTPEEIEEPEIIRSARVNRMLLKSLLQPVAAE